MASAKFDVKTEAAKGLHAGVGAADLAYATVLGYVAEAQKRFEALSKDAQKYLTELQKSVTDLDLEPKALREQATKFGDQATKRVNTRVEELGKDATARRELVEKRVAALQADAQKFVTANVATATSTYGDLAKRGETVVRNLRGDAARTVAPEDKKLVKRESAKPASAKKTAAKKAPSTKTTVKKTTAKKSTAKKSTAKSAK